MKSVLNEEHRLLIAFGPVPSRRLGRSLGVNHIPYKVCTYSCRYCQVGPTLQMRSRRQDFLSSQEIVDAITSRVRDCTDSGETIDYITFVPNGEPTLDANLGAHIRALASLGIPVAVITNASLLWMPDVRSDLAAADLVSVKVDTARPDTWARLNRPHGDLDFETVLGGIRTFARNFGGTLISETMLVGSLNDTAESVDSAADFLGDIAPTCAYLGIPTRPPASPEVVPPSNLALVRAYEIMQSRLDRVELLPVYEAGAFATADDPIRGLLAILAVHPMRESAIVSYLAEANLDTGQLDTLIHEGRVDRVEHSGDVFFVRRPPRAT
jgi:wyosine [tRNA(Phe)-imidazoG37] synthetase (radical SAM superfamily)